MSIHAYIIKIDARFLCIMINVRDTELCKAFGSRLRTLRREQSLSQEKLANKADISISQVSRLERGLLNPTLSTIYALAAALQVAPLDLVVKLKG